MTKFEFVIEVGNVPPDMVSLAFGPVTLNTKSIEHLVAVVAVDG